MAHWRETLQHRMSPVFTHLLQQGFVLPFSVTCIGRNGSMICGRYDDIEATGLDVIFLASHIEDEAFPAPIHMLVVDQRGAAAQMRCEGEEGQGTPGTRTTVVMSASSTATVSSTSWTVSTEAQSRSSR